MKTPIHLCIGQEAVAVGVCAALKREDYVQSNHRGHGHYLAKGGDLKAMIAELHCRETGCSKGRGGSMHLIDTSVGLLGSSSIVGGGVPIGTGLALASSMQKDGRVTATFLGDGAADEGTLYESVNFAMLKSLPVIYVLENNEWSVCSHVSARQKGPNIFHAASEESLFTARIDGNDVLSVFRTVKEAVDRARAGNGPAFIECSTYRVRGHAGSHSDAHLGYRSEGDIRVWEEGGCPLDRFWTWLVENMAATESERAEMEHEIDAEIHAAFAYAQASPLPGEEDVSLYVFRD